MCDDTSRTRSIGVLEFKGLGTIILGTAAANDTGCRVLNLALFINVLVVVMERAVDIATLYRQGRNIKIVIMVRNTT